MSYTVETLKGLAPILRFRSEPLEFIGDAGRRSIDIRQIQLGFRDVFQVNHPDLVRDVLVNHDWNFEKGRGLKASKPFLGNGLLTSEGELHRRQRRLVQPAFHSARLASYAQSMVSCAAQMRGGWKHGVPYAIDQEMMRLTLQIVGQTLFSADLQHDAEGVGESLTQALKLFRGLASPLAQLFAPWRKWAQHRVAQSRLQLENILRPIIEEHRTHPEKYDDMLSMLMGAQDDNTTGYMSDELLLDESLTLFLAGHETTANALTWAWYLLAQHAAEAELLYAELDTVLAGRLPTLDDMPRLDVTGRIFREVLRLYPPAWIIARTAVTDYRLGEVDVPAGSMLFMSPYATQRDPRFWDEPEAFRPDRWKGDANGRPKFAYYPFAAGTRNCIGENFAMMEGVLVMATLAQQWRFGLVPHQTIEPFPRVTLRPRNSIYFTLEEQVRSS
jgi:cytochrome P450